MQKMQKKQRLYLSGLHCASCPLCIEGELEDIGVTACCNYAKQFVDVEYNGKLITSKQIIGVILKAGYTVIQE